MPVVAIPWMKVFCVKKNSTMIGTQISVLAAMRPGQSVPPIRDWKIPLMGRILFLLWLMDLLQAGGWILALAIPVLRLRMWPSSLRK